MIGWLILIAAIALCFRKPILNLFGRGHNQHQQVMQQQQDNYRAVQIQPIQPVYVYQQPQPQPQPYPSQYIHQHQQHPSQLQVNVHQPSASD